MKKLWLYFPENDLALAAGTAVYTPPPAAYSLHRAGEMLPLWMASPGDRIVCGGVNERWLEETCARFGIRNVDVYDHRAGDLIPAPWGWSEASRRAFEDAGFPADRLPDAAYLEHLRQLSHRRTAAEVAARLQRKLSFPITPPACEAEGLGRVEAFLDATGNVIAKSPWSSTGRGLVRSRHMPRAAFLQQTAGIIRRQGSVMLEREYDRVLDFAMLFEADGKGCVSFCGLSLFTTTGRGAYSGNLVAPAQTVRERIAARTGADRLDAVQKALTEVLPAVLGSYAGPLGVDMLLTSDGTLDACVEVNLRYTMGFVALSLEKYLAGSAEGRLEVLPHPEERAAGVKQDADGRICAGSLDLTPPGGDFAFRLSVVSEQ
ncbi:MAG: hypothetical protein K2M12_03850 [Muribaculaceae bacterium]|nr:hypothetical protein [Muribaculaceae bacterium]